jgi:nucleoside-diphosphate-sugar epimerase
MVFDARPVVVTGINSFVGCHLAAGFARAGFRVIGTGRSAAPPDEAIRLERQKMARSAGADHLPLDLTDRDAVVRFIREHRPGVWVHHAGYAFEYASPDYDLEAGHRINIQPLAVVYEALHEVKAGGVIVTGTDAEYGAGDDAWDEEDACWPTAPYGLSKLAKTLRARQLALQYQLPTRVARLFVPFGSLDAPNKLMASVVRALRAGEPIDLTPGEQRRDFIHVDDVVRLYLQLAADLERPSLFEVFNACSGVATRLKDLLLLIAEALKADPALLRFGARPMRAIEAPVQLGSNAKARRLLRWEPRPLTESVRAFLAEQG